jgi:hypothetical protein
MTQSRNIRPRRADYLSVKRRLSASEIETLKRIYVEEDCGLVHAAETLKTSKRIITRSLIDLGIPIRDRGLSKTSEETKIAVIEALASGEAVKSIATRLQITVRRVHFARDEYLRTYDNDRSRFIRSKICKRAVNNDITPTKDISKNAYSRWRKSALDRGLEWDVTIEYLQSILDGQSGNCYYSGVQMVVPFNKGRRRFFKKNLRLATLERLDSDKGYITGNVAFCCHALNLGKSDWPESDFVSFLDEISTLRTASYGPHPEDLLTG